MENPTLRTALLVVCATIGIIARATDCPLTTPPPSSYPDTESSVNVAVTNWPSLGRRVKLTLSADFTPSNGVQVALGQDSNADGDLEPGETRVVFGVDCVQIAFGQDSDSDGDLAPEETHLILGVDCGEPFARWEVVVGSRSPTVEWSNFLCTPTTNIYDFTFKQPSAVPSRMNFAKVTTRGRGNSAAEIAAEIRKPGVVLYVR